MSALTEIRPLLNEISLELSFVTALSLLIDDTQEGDLGKPMRCLSTYRFAVMGLYLCLSLFEKAPWPEHLSVKSEISNTIYRFELEALKVRALCSGSKTPIH